MQILSRFISLISEDKLGIGSPDSFQLRGKLLYVGLADLLQLYRDGPWFHTQEGTSFQLLTEKLLSVSS